VKKMRRRQTDLPKHVADAIRDAWPDGVIDVSVDWDDAPFWQVYSKLNAALSHIPRSAIFYERSMHAVGIIRVPASAAVPAERANRGLTHGAPVEEGK
jgi:hypothetical protein